MNQPTLNATEGATALDINSLIEQNKQSELMPEQKKQEKLMKSLENISMENATYLQNVEKKSSQENLN